MLTARMDNCVLFSILSAVIHAFPAIHNPNDWLGYRQTPFLLLLIHEH